MKTQKNVNGLLVNDVLTLDEAADFLRISPREVRSLVDSGSLPGRPVEDGYRFQRDALRDWLSGKNSERQAFLSMAGKYAGDESLKEIRRSARKARGLEEKKA